MTNPNHVTLPSLCTVPEEYVGQTVDADIVNAKVQLLLHDGYFAQIGLSIDGKLCYDGWLLNAADFNNTIDDEGYHTHKWDAWWKHFGIAQTRRVNIDKRTGGPEMLYVSGVPSRRIHWLGDITDLPFSQGGYKANITVLRNKRDKVYIKLNHITKDGNVIAIQE